MIYKKLGKSNLEVSRIGFGGIPIQRVSKEESASVIHRAEDLGVNFIDTAMGYTVSQEYIGYALRGRRDKWIIATKSMARTKDAMLKDIETGLKSMETDYIDLYQIHNVNNMDDYKTVMGSNGALEALLEAQKAGKIGHIGFTSHKMTVLQTAMETELFESIMYPYNIVERQADELFKRAKELNLGVIAMKPMAGGALKDGTLAMRFILQNENITCAIPGMATTQEVEANVKAAEDFRPLTNEEIELCQKISNELGTVFCRRCGYCMPCNKGIDIPYSFILKSYFDNYDLKDWAVSRYKGHKAHAEDCIECGQCESKCPYNLPIRNMLKDVKKTFGF